MQALGLFPLPDDATLGQLFADLAAALRDANFTDTGRLPRPGNPWHAFFDADNLRRYRHGGINSHEVSAFAPVFYWDFGRRSSRTLRLFELSASTGWWRSRRSSERCPRT